MPDTVLTETQIETYYREGYVVAEGLVPDAVAASVREAASQRKVESGGGWTPSIFDPEQPEADADLHRCLTEPRVLSAVEQVFENKPAIFYGMVAVVPPRGGKGLEWHQDNQYTQLLGRALNVFIALGDITPDMAILWVAPQTHRLGMQRSETQDGHRKAADPGNGQPLPAMKAGDACIFDRNTLHRSLTNDTDLPRYAYAAQFAEVTAREAETGKRPQRLVDPATLAERFAVAV